MGKKRRSAGDIITTCISAVIILALITFIILQVFLPTEGMRVFGFKAYMISDTESMEPLLSFNDFIVVKRAEFDGMREGNIIAFTSRVEIDGNIHVIPITHQIVEIITNEETGAKSFRTSGINVATNPDPDLRFVTIDGARGTNVFVGQYAYTIPVLGHVVGFLKSPYGLATLAFNVLVIATITYIIKSSKDSDARRRREPHSD